MGIKLSIDSMHHIAIGNSELATIITCLNTDKRLGQFCAHLFDHPASEVRSAVAAISTLPLDELQCLASDPSIEVVRQVANNNRALKYFGAPLLLKMIRRDVSVAAGIAGNLFWIRESVRRDVIDALLQHTDPAVVETTQTFVDDYDLEDTDFVDDIEDDDEALDEDQP